MFSLTYRNPPTGFDDQRLLFPDDTVNSNREQEENPSKSHYHHNLQ